jgi:hypothetical protein
MHVARGAIGIRRGAADRGGVVGIGSGGAMVVTGWMTFFVGSASTGALYSSSSGTSSVGTTALAINGNVMFHSIDTLHLLAYQMR